jgi:DNA-binding NtrC family response regulator
MNIEDLNGNGWHGPETSGLEELERRARSADGSPALPLREWVALAEAWRIAQALRQTRGNRSAAARLLGIGRRTLYTKMEKLGLEPTWSLPLRDDGPALRPAADAEASRP